MDAQALLTSVLAGGGATVVATEILKSKYVPVAFEKYPRATAVVVSLVSAVIAEYQAGVNIDLHNVAQLAAVFVGTVFVAVSVYDHLVKKS